MVYLLTVVVVLLGMWALRTWLVWDRRGAVERTDGGGARAGSAKRISAATGPDVGSGAPRSLSDRGPVDTDARRSPPTGQSDESRREQEAARQALRERSEQIIGLDREAEARQLRQASPDEPDRGGSGSRQSPPTAPAEERAIQPLFEASAEKDDLKLIKGIGPVMEGVLNQLGITSFKRLATLTQDDIERVSAAIGTFSGRIERDDWVGKAKIHYREKYGESA